MPKAAAGATASQVAIAHQFERFRLALVKVAALRGRSFGESAEVTAAVRVVPEPIESFKKFFAHEFELQKDAAQTGPSFKHGIDDTPERIDDTPCVEGAQQLRSLMVATLRGRLASLAAMVGRSVGR